jgi:hypothetical protein
MSDFFPKITKTAEVLNPDTVTTNETGNVYSGPISESGGSLNATSTRPDVGISATNDEHANDFGLAVGKKLSDVDKFGYLTNCYTPSVLYMAHCNTH